MKADNIRVLQAFQHLHLFTETLALCFGQLTGLQRANDHLKTGGNVLKWQLTAFNVSKLSKHCPNITIT